jgi:flagellar biosynthesis/type III secretory pathway chaperone
MFENNPHVKQKQSLEMLETQLLALESHLGLLHALIQEEHVAISQHDLLKVEQCCRDKEALLKKIEGLKNLTQTIFYSIGSPDRSAYGSSVALQELLALLKQQKHDYSLNKIELSVQNIRSQYVALQKDIKKNKIILEKMIENHQESYRFWLEITQESNSFYTAKGEKGRVALSSQIEIKT